MHRTIFLASLLIAGSTGLALAADYDAPPPGDAQYAQCIRVTVNRYTGGMDKSPIAGQSKVEAFCTCMWNETPDDFKGNLANFAETAKGAAMNKQCEKHANWES